MADNQFDFEFLKSSSLQRLMVLLNEEGGKVRIAGGAVRNALMGEPVADIDLATSLLPDEVARRAQKAGYKVIPTGLEHGTVTVVIDGDAYEVTTLRRDVQTDGRHAKVEYGTDWQADARRRDLTMNALYIDGDGTLFDPLGGIDDVRSKTVRFIDDAEMRIQEDYLRILRFFRFFAWYGSHRPDAEGLKACARLKTGLQTLSAERVWQELCKILSAPDPSRAVLWMRQTGVLAMILPEGEKWGIDSLAPLIKQEQEHQWPEDCLLRLMAILPPQEQKLTQLSARLKVPNKVKKRLLAWADMALPHSEIKQADFEKFLFEKDKQAMHDHLYLALTRDDEMYKKRLRQLKWLKRWQEPDFPLKGKDLLEHGFAAGPAISEKLQDLKAQWVESQFSLSKQELLQLI